MRAPRFSSFWRKLSDVRYRHGYVSSQLKRGVPLQIRALRLQRKLSQASLAELCGLTQGAISRAENPEYGDLTFNTVLKIARGLDVAFVGRFISFGDFEDFTGNYATGFDALSFEEENQAHVAGELNPDGGDVGAELPVTYGVTSALPPPDRASVAENVGRFRPELRAS